MTDDLTAAIREWYERHEGEDATSAKMAAAYNELALRLRRLVFPPDMSNAVINAALVIGFDYGLPSSVLDALSRAIHEAVEKFAPAPEASHE